MADPWSTLAQQVPVSALRRYLRSQRWQVQILENDRTDLFYLADGQSSDVELFIPKTNGSNGATRYKIYALETLGDILQATPVELLSRLRSIGFDIWLLALPDEAVMWKSINLDVAEGVIKHARRLLAYSATLDEVKVAAFSRTSYIGDEYADRCRFGHTFEGSFGFTIESPIGPHTETLMGPDDTPPPERRYIERLIRGTHILKQAEIEKNPGLIVDSFANAFNSNMCDEIEKMIKSSSTGSITSSFNLSPEWSAPPDFQVIEPIQLGSGVLPILREASSTLKRTDIDPNQTIIGPVVLLSSRENPADLEHTSGSREFAIEHNTEDGLIRVYLQVDPLTYRKAYEAHGAGRQVTARGKIEQRRRKWFMRDVKYFDIVT